jgi:hypothetical protein
MSPHYPAIRAYSERDDSVRILTPYLLSIYFNIIHPSTHRYSTLSVPFRLSNQNFARISLPSSVLLPSSHYPLLDPNNIQ